MVSQTDDVHLCIMCLRAIMNYQVFQISAVLQSELTRVPQMFHRAHGGRHVKNSCNRDSGSCDFLSSPLCSVSSDRVRPRHEAPALRQRAHAQPEQQEPQVGPDHLPLRIRSPLTSLAHINVAVLLRTKALVLELLAAVCLVRGGHDIILSAFDHFKEVFRLLSSCTQSEPVVAPSETARHPA